MASRDGEQLKGRHVSQPLVAEYDTIEGLEEPVSVGAWRPVVSASKATGSSGRYNDYSRNTANYSKNQPRSEGPSVTKILGIALALLLVGALGYAGFQVFKSNYKEQVNQQLRPESEAEDIAAREVLTPTTSRDTFYMMIVGVDVLDEGETQRSDTNIVARVDPQNGIITMVSIPRDTAINLEGYGTQKFNAAYAYGGIPSTIKAAESLLGVKISHYAVIDFSGMVSLVDAIGGVDVDVPVYIDDPDAGAVTVEAGPQHLDGEHALVFARSRAYATGDFQRSANQRQLISAMLNQAMTLNTADLPRVIEAASECMTTDMSVTMLQDYALYFMNFEEITVYSVMMPSGVAMSEGVSYVVCDTPALLKVMQAVDAGEDPSQYVEDYTVANSAEAQAAGMEDAIGIDSRLIEGGYIEEGDGYYY